MRQVLIENQVFLTADDLGDIPYGNTEGLGLYYQDTRFLSVYELLVNGLRPSKLTSSVEQNFMGNLQLANPTYVLADGTVVPALTISIRRNRFIGERSLQERIGFFNYNRFRVPVKVELIVGADFKDMFDVRGIRRVARGELLPPTTGEHILDGVLVDNRFSLNYRGLDGVARHSDVVLDRTPHIVEMLAGGQLRLTLSAPSAGMIVPIPEIEPAPPSVRLVYEFDLEPQKPESLTLSVTPRLEEPEPPRRDPVIIFDMAAVRLRRAIDEWYEGCTQVETNNKIFDTMFARSVLDLRALLSQYETGPYIWAGIPWFAAPFGRDGAITSLQCLMLNPDLAVGTLRFLAAHQGREVNDFRDEDPGKIMHELRAGEMARRGEIPHTPYYGSIDATPLFLILFAQTMDWLDDDALYRELKPAVLWALEWVDRYGDLDGDGFVEYKTRSPRGIRNQAWKDSDDAYAFPDGRWAEPPIAPVEVQGYVYDAKRRLAALFRRKDEPDLADRLEREAEELRRRFEERFWMPDERFYAQGLDREKVQIPAVTSNPGHCLWSGIIAPDRAELVRDRLLSPQLFSGWGVRTLSKAYPTFNPMSYHNGSVWPHDNSIIANGLRRYGFDEEALQVISAIYQAGLRFPLYRLPELFCGFDRDERYRSTPAEYPVSCSPQAWAAGSVIFFVTTMLGLRADAAHQRLYVRPVLPPWLDWVALHGLRIGRARVDLRVRDRRLEDVIVREGVLEVVDEFASQPVIP